MSARIQGLIVAVGKAKQVDIATASVSFMRLKKLNADMTTANPTFEDDSDEIGRGNEFISQVFPVAHTAGGSLDKYASVEFLTWCAAYGLGNTAQTGSAAPWMYTITPIDPGVSIELPYFSYVEQLPEGGGSALDNLFIGAALEEFNVTFDSTPGRASAKCTATWIGSGLLTTPSGVSVPALTVESGMIAQSMALTINGTNYVGNKKIVEGSFGWKNNLSQGYFPGSGLQDGGAVMGRIEIGKRMPSFSFTARLAHDSDEYTKLVAQTTGTATITFTKDSNNTVTYTWQKVSFEAVTNSVTNGLAAVTVKVAPQYDNTNGILTFTSKCGITGIGQ